MLMSLVHLRSKKLHRVFFGSTREFLSSELRELRELPTSPHWTNESRPCCPLTVANDRVRWQLSKRDDHRFVSFVAPFVEIERSIYRKAEDNQLFELDTSKGDE